MKTCINISFPSKVRFRKKVHSQASDHVWFFLNLFSKRPREKGGKKKKGFMYIKIASTDLRYFERANVTRLFLGCIEPNVFEYFFFARTLRE